MTAIRVSNRLAKHPVLRSTPSKEILDFAWPVREKVYSILLSEAIGESCETARVIVEHVQRQDDAEDFIPAASEIGFRDAFAKAVMQDASQLGRPPLKSYGDILSDVKRVENFRFIEWLLDNTQDESSKKKLPQQKHKVPPIGSQAQSPSMGSGRARSTSSGSTTRIKSAKRPLKEEPSLSEAGSCENNALLLQESSQESYDTRRVYLLKSQNMQLERQVILQTEILETISGSLTFFENFVLEMERNINSWKGMISGSDKDSSRMSVHIHADELDSMIKKLGSAKQRLGKSGRSRENMPTVPYEFSSKFATKTPTILDVCLGSTDHLNVRNISLLEDSLYDLHTELVQLEVEFLAAKSFIGSSYGGDKQLEDRITSCKRATAEAGDSLLSLSILGPHPPVRKRLEYHDRHRLTLPSVGELIATLPENINQKTKGLIERLLERCLAAVEHALALQQSSERVLRQELAARFGDTAVEEADVRTKKEKALNLIGNTLPEILRSYEMMRTIRSETVRKEFLSHFESQIPMLNQVMELLDL
eukprot:m.166196 g.166196  ORF g.166196 m.166196 type:complete len:536 (+) comp15272_c0_seq3:126-1733(+)